LFPPLSASVSDAEAFSAEMEKAGAGLYAEVRVAKVLDADATVAKLDETFRKLASEISPRDTFVFYAAAHGYTVGGNYYMIPQDYQGGPEQKALKTRAIGQDRIQDWIANRVKAKKAIILLDTCESGALTGGYTQSRTEGPVSEAAVGRLHEATGRPVLTAASGGKSAYEGYKGHGVFTYALIEALHKGDTNNNGKIEVTELAAHVERRVPELFAELKANGWVVKGVTVAAARGPGTDAQSAHFGTTGGDFSLVNSLDITGTAAASVSLPAIVPLAPAGTSPAVSVPAAKQAPQEKPAKHADAGWQPKVVPPGSPKSAKPVLAPR